MGDNSKIEWTDATWNFILGCFYKSIGCTFCYAVWTCWRLAHNPNPKIAAAYAGLVRKTGDGKLVWTGKINVVEERLTLPLRWKRPRKIFVNSQSDLFHPDVSFDVIDRAFAVMALCSQHVFQILTKRPARMREYFGDWTSEHGTVWTREEIVLNAQLAHDEGEINQLWPLPNVWLGTSVENQKAADERIPDLLATPAAVRFLSCEPLLGPVDLKRFAPFCSSTAHWVTTGECACETHPSLPLHWIIVGGESGRNARPMHPDWARSLRDQCQAAGVPFFFKQWGEWREFRKGDDPFQSSALTDLGTNKLVALIRPGKRAAGRKLDGREWNEMPQSSESVVSSV